MQDRLALHGIRNVSQVHWNLNSTELVEHALRRGEGQLADNGALLVTTGQHTGRAPQDKFIVDDSETHERVNWGNVNKPFDSGKFDLAARVFEEMSTGGFSDFLTLRAYDLID